MNWAFSDGKNACVINDAGEMLHTCPGRKNDLNGTLEFTQGFKSPLRINGALDRTDGRLVDALIKHQAIDTNSGPFQMARRGPTWGFGPDGMIMMQF